MPTARAPHRIAAGLAAALAVAAAPAARADEVLLKTGGRVSGVIVERTSDRVVIDTAPGRVTLPMTRVARVVEGQSALATYRERAAAVGPLDGEGWAELARWAEARGLTTQSQEAWARVLEVMPGHPQANAALGRMQVDGRWMAADAAYRAQGYVQYEGRWVTPVEHEARLRERAAEDAERRERRENEARVREAEARASEAEARAREAAEPYDDGVPYWWGYGYGGGGVVGPPIGHWPDRPSVGPRPPPRPPVTPSPPRATGGGSRPSPPTAPGGPGPSARPTRKPYAPPKAASPLPAPPQVRSH